MPSATVRGLIYQFCNCRLLQNHAIVQDDLWVRNGKILNPEELFYVEKAYADIQIDCKGSIISPGYIDIQINGAFGEDFSLAEGDTGAGVRRAAKGLLGHGVTSFCPTVITSPPHVYHKIIPSVKVCDGSRDGAGVLGLHLEGPFLSIEKRGAHNEKDIRTFKNGFQEVLDTYGSLENVVIVTLAPELERSGEIIEELCKRGIKVALGHTSSDLVTGEEAIRGGANCITHLFNGMLSFHHRDPHLIGALSSSQIPTDRVLYYGLIADGIHTHPAALRIAYRVHPKGLILVTDAIPPMGLQAGTHHMGSQQIEIRGKRAVIAGTDILCGSIAEMDKCVRKLMKNTGCGIVHALESATLHPAEMLGITDRKGTLDYGTDADFVMLDQSLNPLATYIAGDKVWDSGKLPGL